ncbi:L,D-transpeptidase [Thermomonas brevis]
MHLRTALAALLFALPLSVVAQAPAAKAPTAAAASRDTLKPGQFLWHPEIAPSGPIVLVVSLDEQRAYVYRNGMAIGVSTISSGKVGKETPTGVFTILQKNRDHRSNLYNNAPMPFMQRLTWDGIALHGGALPGYPASHGCVRLPHAFAEKLFAETRTGDTVVVANAKASTASIARPAVLAPVARDGSATTPRNILAGYYWNQTLADADGPVSVLVSLADRRVFALRNGVAFAEAALEVEDGFRVGGSVLIVTGEAEAGAPSVLAPERPRRAWSAYPILGVDADSLAMLQLRLQDMPLQVDPGFSRRLYEMLAPGSTLLLTDLPAVRPEADAPALQPVLESDETTAATR